MLLPNTVAKIQYDNGYKDALKTAVLWTEYDIFCFFSTSSTSFKIRVTLG